MVIATSGERSGRNPARPSPGRGAPAATSSILPATTAQVRPISSTDLFLVNAAFLQEIKDSNAPLWHQVHELRTCCEAGQHGEQSPYQTMKGLVTGLSELRDLLAFQFTLEESYGFVRVGALPPGSSRHIDEQAIRDARRAIDQHRRLYLQAADLVEAGEEVQYRGCQLDGLKPFIGQLEDLLAELTAHERLEADLIGATHPELAESTALPTSGPRRRTLASGSATTNETKAGDDREQESERKNAERKNNQYGESPPDQPSPLDG